MNKSCEVCRFKIGREEFDMKRCKKCSRTEKAYFEPLPTAADIMEGIMEDGTYPSLKLAERRKADIKSRIQEKLASSEERRHEFTQWGYVAKFVPKKVHNIDYVALNEYLYDCGYLLYVVRIDHALLKKNGLTELFESYKEKPTYSLSVSFNKAGKEKKDSYIHSSPLSSDIEGLMEEYAHQEKQYLHFSSLYEKAKKEMEKCEVLQEKRKLQYKYGSVYLKENKPTYDIGRIYEELGVEYLINYGKPDSKKIQTLIQRGSISQNELDQFKTLVDIKLDFMLMPLESERSMMENFHRMNIQAAHNRMRA